jgi:hypothetical protein
MDTLAFAPTPTHVSYSEEGEWWDYKTRALRAPVYAIRFSDNSILDLIKGEWRKYQDPREEAIKAFMEEVVLELRDRHCTSYCSGDSPPRSIRCNEDQFKRALRGVLELYETVQKRSELKK